MPTKIDFIGGNTKRCLMAMALPMIAAMFLNMMYNLVDSLWIGNLLGETAYAALTHSYHSDLNLCCDGGDKWCINFDLSGDWRKRQEKNRKFDFHIVLCGGSFLPPCNRSA